MANRNAESRFAINPTNIDIQRSRFSRNSRHVTTFDAGRLVPFYIDEVLPGDTHDVRTSMVVRMPTLVTPLMDNIYIDCYFFYIPNRLCWEHWKEFMGENTASAWIPQVEYSVPQLEAPSGGWNTGTIADYMGVPPGVDGFTVNALPFRGYSIVANEWFRDENLLDPLNIPVSDSTVTGTNGTNYINDTAKGGAPFPVAKMHDYFSAALPGPQKGPDVSISVTTGGVLPVFTTDTPIDYADLPKDANGKPFPLLFRTTNLNPSSTTDYESANAANKFAILNKSLTDWNGTNTLSPVVIPEGATGYEGSAHLGPIPSNLYAADAGSLTVATISQLRTAFQIQKYYERAARGGTRYIEVLKSFFNVTSPDYRLQRPEYLGGQRLPVTITQVVQNSETGTTPLGDTAGYSLTVDVHKDFTKSFTEHGFILGVMCARYPHTYAQGLERFWSRKKIFDYYFPVFANLSEMAVLNKEIYLQGTTQDDEVFGYQEPWADYRYKQNRCSGLMRPQVTGTLAFWNLADNYQSLPTLSDTWICEDKTNIDRTIAVPSQPQFIADIYVQNNTTRPMPLYSIPGLIDHH